MINLDNLSGKKVVIMGLGLYEQGSGGMAAQFFARRGARVLATDLRPAGVLEPALKRLRKLKNIKYVLGKHRLSDFQNAEIVFQNPSVPAGSPYLAAAKKAGALIVNDWSIFLSLHQPKVFVGVTGTRGKSTTTALIFEMLKKKYKNVRLAGNLGVSPLSFVDSYKGEPIVAELSSWLLHHFSEIKKSPNVAVITNIMNDHMDKYASPKEYIADKENIFRFQHKGNVVVFNYDNLITRGMAKKAFGRLVWFSLKKHLPKWAPLKSVKLLGEHNLANALAAAAAAEAAGVSRRGIISVLKTFKGLPDRLELVREINGVRYYNDTTATTPDATISALRTLSPSPYPSHKGRGDSSYFPSLDGRELKGGWKQKQVIKRIVLICGGADKKLDFKELAKYIKKYCKAVILFKGNASEKIQKFITHHSSLITGVKSMKEAVNIANNFISKGDIILLSPAAASFGLFKNEFDRGEQFVREATDNRLIKQKFWFTP